MLRRAGYGFLILVLTLSGAAFVGAHAQQLFINKSQNNADGDVRPKVFVTPKGQALKSKTKPASIGHATKLKIARDLNFNADAVKLYEYWLNSGQKPQTIEEMVAFKHAKSAVNYGGLLDRKRAMIPHLNKIYARLDVPARGALNELQDYTKTARLIEGTMKAQGVDLRFPKNPKDFNAYSQSARDQKTSRFVSKVETPFQASGQGQVRSVTVKTQQTFNDQ